MAEQQNVLIKILADVAGANASFGKLQKTLANLSGGTITLAKNMNAFEQGVRGSIGAQRAAEKVSKAHAQIMRQRLNLSRAEAAGIKAIAEMHRAEAAAINAKIALRKAELAGDQVVLREMQQELQLRRLSIQEIELENRQRRALNATKKTGAQATGEATAQIQANVGATGSASFALLSLGQAFQDSAQFGMGFAQGLRAVNNNVQQVFTALALGSTQAGGFKNLLATMRGQLIGPGGLILLFSALSAGLEIFVTRAQKAKVSASDLSESISNLITSTSDIQQLELNYDVVNQAVIDQEKIVERLAKDVEGSVARGEGALRVSGGLSHAAAENMRAAGLTEVQIQNLRRGGLEAGKQELAVQRAILEDLSDRRLKIETDMRVASAMRKNEAIEAHRQETEALGEIDDAVDAGNKLKLDGVRIDKESTGGIAALIEKNKELSATLAVLSGTQGQRIFDLRNEQNELIKQIELLEKIDALNRLPLMRLEMREQELIPLQTAISERMEEIQRSTTLVGRMQGAEGFLVSDLRTLAPEVELEMQLLGEVIDEQNRNINTSFKGWWNNNKDAVGLSAQLMQQSIGQIGSTFMQLAQTGDKQNKRLFETGKKFAIAQALISTYVGFTKAIEQGGPLGIITGASVLAAGMAKVQAIRSTTMSGGGGGGGSSSGGIRGLGSLQEFNVGNLYSGTPNIGSAAGFPSLSIGSMAPQGMQLQLVARGPDLVSAVDAQRSANTRLIGGSR